MCGIIDEIPVGDEQEIEQDEWDAHRRNLPYCSKCGGTCYFDDEGARVIDNQVNEEPSSD